MTSGDTRGPILSAESVATLHWLAPLIQSTVRRQLAGNPARSTIDEEAVVQEAWLSSVRAVQRKPELLDNGNSLGGYVHVLARNCTIDAIRSAQRHIRRTEHADCVWAMAHVPDNCARSSFDRIEAEVVLRQVIDNLWTWNQGLAQTSVLLLENDFELPLAVLATNLGVSTSTACRLRAQALACFRRALTED